MVTVNRVALMFSGHVSHFLVPNRIIYVIRKHIVNLSVRSCTFNVTLIMRIVVVTFRAKTQKEAHLHLLISILGGVLAALTLPAQLLQFTLALLQTLPFALVFHLVFLQGSLQGGNKHYKQKIRLLKRATN